MLLCKTCTPPTVYDQFEQVAVDEQTDTITWPGDVDLDHDVIYAVLDLGPDKTRVYVLDRSIVA